MSMKLDVYFSDPTQEAKELIQTFVLDDDGTAKPTMKGDTSWANSAKSQGNTYTPEDGEKFLRALADKLNASTYLTAKFN